jgi:hypothetical protein
MESVGSTADYQFSIRRFVVSSADRVVDSLQAVSINKRSEFKWRPIVDMNEQITRFAVRSIHFPHLASGWDTGTKCPVLYIECIVSGDSKGYWKVPLKGDRLTSLDLIVSWLINSSGPYTTWTPWTSYADPRSSGSTSLFCVPVADTTNSAARIIGVKVINSQIVFNLNTLSSTVNLIIHNQVSLANPSQYLLSKSKFNLGLPAFDIDTGESIFGLVSPVLLNNNTPVVGNTITLIDVVPAFKPNIQPEQSFYLCSQRLSTASRSFPANMSDISSSIALIPVGGKLNLWVDYDNIDATEYTCTGDDQLNEIDFSLRYHTGGLVDLGSNDWTIEVEIETVLLKNTSRRQMSEAIQLPNFNTYASTQLLGQGKKRSFGSISSVVSGRRY